MRNFQLPILTTKLSCFKAVHGVVFTKKDFMSYCKNSGGIKNTELLRLFDALLSRQIIRPINKVRFNWPKENELNTAALEKLFEAFKIKSRLGHEKGVPCPRKKKENPMDINSMNKDQLLSLIDSAKQRIAALEAEEAHRQKVEALIELADVHSKEELINFINKY